MSAVVRESLCHECANTGRRLHPSWAQLLEAWHALHPNTRDEPDEDFVRAWFWRHENADPVPRFVVCGCQERRSTDLGGFQVDHAQIIGAVPYPCAHEPLPERVDIDYRIGGQSKRRRIPLRRLVAFLELAEQRLGLRLDEEGDES